MLCQGILVKYVFFLIIFLRMLWIPTFCQSRHIFFWFQFMCFAVPFVELAVSHESVLTILAITVERYYAICRPLQAGEVCTKTKACFTCFVTWIIAFGLTAPVLAIVKFDHKEDSCLTDVKLFWHKFYFVFIITVFFFIPLVILIYLYRQIARNLKPLDQQVCRSQMI